MKYISCTARVIFSGILGLVLSLPTQAATYLVTNSMDTNVMGSLRYGISQATANGYDEIVLSSTFTITLQSALPAINRALIIYGNNSTIVGPDVGAAFRINSGRGVTFNNLTITQARPAIFNSGDLTLNAVIVSESFRVGASNHGAAIYTEGALKISEGIFQNNVMRQGAGGAIHNEAGTLTIENSVFSDNLAVYLNGAGGAIYSNGGNVTIKASEFRNNMSEIGGAIAGKDYALSIEDSVFESNSTSLGASEGHGGAIHGLCTTASTFSIKRTRFLTNAAWSGGAIGSSNCALDILNSEFTENVASVGGYGAINSSGSLSIVGSSFLRNASTALAGVIRQTQNSPVIISNSTFNGNSSASASAPSVLSANSAVITNSTFVNNVGSNVAAILAQTGAGSGVTLHNVLMVNGPSGGNCTGAIVASADSISDDASCGSATQTSASAINVAPLADNGGSTLTHALLPGSIAIDAGDDTHCPDTDQRGFKRPQGNACDVGAFESGLDDTLFKDGFDP